MVRPAVASQACKVKLVRFRGRPEAKLKNRTAAMRLSRSACSSVGLGVLVKRSNLRWPSGAIITAKSRRQRVRFTFALAARRIPCQTSGPMTLAYKREFLDLCMRLGVVKFGRFKLKSGRESPYFFNAGLFNSGAAIAAVGRAYASAVAASDVPFDMLFG